MSRHSSTIDLILEKGKAMKIGTQPVIISCTTEGPGNADKMVVNEMYVSKATGNLVIVYDDGE